MRCFFHAHKLRAHEEDHGNAEAVELFGQLEVNVGEVDEDGYVWTAVADGLLSRRNSR